MIQAADAQKVFEFLGNNLSGASRDPQNFVGLPDRYCGYYARGHDSNGWFGVIAAYSEAEGDVDDLIAMYKEWVRKNIGDSAASKAELRDAGPR